MNTMKKTLFYLGLLVLAVSFCSKKQTTENQAAGVEDLLPKSDEISGWKWSGNTWRASSSGELNGAIDGEESVYTQRGFVEAAMREYGGKVSNTSCNVEMRIFDQGSAANAKSVFDHIGSQLHNPSGWNPPGASEGKIEKMWISQKIIFLDGRHFIQLTITSSLNEALDVLKTFAGNAADKIR
jgi:hypothetical protein